MIKLIKKPQDAKDRFQFYLLAILSCFCILPNALQSITAICLVGVSLIFNYKLLGKEIKKIGIKPYIFTIAWLLVLSISLFYSIEIKAGLIYMRKATSLFLITFTIFYCFPKLTQKRIHLIIKIFIFSNILFVCYVFYYLIENLSLYYQPDLKSQSTVSQVLTLFGLPHVDVMWYGIKNGVKTPLTIHKTYLSLNLLMAVFSIIYLFLNNKNSNAVNSLWIFIILFFLVPIFYFKSMVNIPILAIGVLYLLFIKQKTKEKKILLLTAYIFITVCVFVVVFSNINKTNSVFKTTLIKKINYVLDGVTYSSAYNSKEKDKRSVINSCSKDLFLEKPFFGYGLGAQHIYLTSCYAERKEFQLVEGNFNTHNHYYFLLLSGGLSALIAFIIMLFYFMRAAINRNNALMIVFLITIILNLLVENILTRINGVLFFAIFLPILYRYSIIKN